MRILIYKVEDGVYRRLILPARRAHLPPVVVEGTDKVAVAASLAEAIETVGRAETPPAKQPPLL